MATPACPHLRLVVGTGYMVNTVYNAHALRRLRRLFRDKRATKAFLREAGVRVPRDLDPAQVPPGQVIVVKPCCATHGDGVRIGPAARLLAEAPLGPEDMVEEFVPGRNYRIIVLRGSIVGAVVRSPAAVVGDGRSTVAELIAARDSARCVPLTCDDACAKRLGDVPAAGEEVRANRVSNYMQGGGVDRVPLLHADVHALCARIAVATGARIFGVDLIAADAAQPLASQAWAVNELELHNGLRMHYELQDDVWKTYRRLGAGIMGGCLALALVLVALVVGLVWVGRARARRQRALLGQ